MRDGIWWIKYRIHPRHRHHVLRLDMGPGYRDKDEILMIACFTVLRRFIEKEKPHVTIVVKDHNRAEWREIFFLYRWWTRYRKQRKPIPYPGDHKDISLFAANSLVDTWAALSNQQDDDWHKEDQEMLHRLINVRRYMWT